MVNTFRHPGPTISLSQIMDPQFKQSAGWDYRRDNGVLKLCPNGCGAIVASGLRTERWIYDTSPWTQTCAACDMRNRQQRDSDEGMSSKGLTQFLAAQAGCVVAENLLGAHISSDTWRDATYYR